MSETEPAPEEVAARIASLRQAYAQMFDQFVEVMYAVQGDLHLLEVREAAVYLEVMRMMALQAANWKLILSGKPELYVDQTRA